MYGFKFSTPLVEHIMGACIIALFVHGCITLTTPAKPEPAHVEPQPIPESEHTITPLPGCADGGIQVLDPEGLKDGELYVCGIVDEGRFSCVPYGKFMEAN